eukprot:990758-Rhodomonas_salina.1
MSEAIPAAEKVCPMLAFTEPTCRGARRAVESGSRQFGAIHGRSGGNADRLQVVQGVFRAVRGSSWAVRVYFSHFKAVQCSSGRFKAVTVWWCGRGDLGFIAVVEWLRAVQGRLVAVWGIWGKSGAVSHRLSAVRGVL